MNDLRNCLFQGGRVLIVIGGDDQYIDEDEEERVVISRWARRKVASQFNEEFLDGRKSFIFSWNKRHREIHEEALLHYFDPGKKGQKFEYQPKPKPVPKIKEPPRPVIPASGAIYGGQHEVSTEPAKMDCIVLEVSLLQVWNVSEKKRNIEVKCEQ